MSNFLERAKRRHARGDVTGAAFMLADGLRRDQTNIEALEWFMHLYMREMTRAGAERELITVLKSQPNGGMLFAKVCKRLDEVGDTARLDALRRETERLGVPMDTGLPYGVEAPVPEEPELPQSRPPLRTPVPAEALMEPAENWEAFSSPLEGATTRQGDASPSGGGGRAGLPRAIEPDETVDIELPSSHEASDRSRTVAVAVVVAVLIAIAAAFFLIPERSTSGENSLEPAPGSGAAP